MFLQFFYVLLLGECVAVHISGHMVESEQKKCIMLNVSETFSVGGFCCVNNKWKYASEIIFRGT